MIPSRDAGSRAPLLAATCTALLILLAGWTSLGRPASSCVAVLALAFLPYALLVALPEDAFAQRDGRWALLCTGITAAGLCWLDPPLSDDVYRFLWDGRVLRHGIDPYRYAPLDPTLVGLHDGFWTRINHPDIPTVYPPLAQLAFAALGGLWHSPHVMQVAASCALLGSGLLLLGQAGPRAATLLVLNPLALSESALNGHLDIAVGGTLLACFIAVWRGRVVRASMWLTVATGLKMVGLLLAPLLGRARRGAGWLALALSVAVLLPQLLASGEAVGGAGHYARRWRGNDGGFALLETAASFGLTQLAGGAERAHGHIRLEALEPLLAVVEGGPLDPRRGSQPAKKWVPDRSDFAIPFLAGLLARATWVLLLTLSLGVLFHLAIEPAQAARTLLLLGLWWAPQVHPWYLLWLLPLECLLGGLTGIAWSLMILAAYAPLDAWLTYRIWNESETIRALEFGAVAVVWALEPWLLETRRPPPPAATEGTSRLDRDPSDAATC